MDLRKQREIDRETERQENICWLLQKLEDDLQRMSLETIKHLRTSDRVLLIGR